MNTRDYNKRQGGVLRTNFMCEREGTSCVRERLCRYFREQVPQVGVHEYLERCIDYLSRKCIPKGSCNYTERLLVTPSIIP